MRRLRSIGIAIAVAVAVAATSVASASAQDNQALMAATVQCLEGNTAELRVQGCTFLVNSDLVQSHPEILAQTFNNRAIAYRQMQAYERAIYDYNQALRLDPDYAAAYNNRALAYSRMGEYERAIADYDRALSIEPTRTAAYRDRGRSHCRLGQAEAALADWLRYVTQGGPQASRQVQAFLGEEGYYTGPVDGVIGPTTLNALEAYAAADCG